MPKAQRLLGKSSGTEAAPLIRASLQLVVWPERAEIVIRMHCRAGEKSLLSRRIPDRAGGAESSTYSTNDPKTNRVSITDSPQDPQMRPRARNGRGLAFEELIVGSEQAILPPRGARSQTTIPLALAQSGARVAAGCDEAHLATNRLGALRSDRRTRR